MKIEVIIDKLTPCLIEVSTGKEVQTVFSVASEDDISGLAESGWLFDWTADELRNTNVYKLLIKGDDIIHGLVSTEVIRGAVYVHLVESAPYNRGTNKQYEGVGGHLFAIAMKLSVVMVLAGIFSLMPKTLNLLSIIPICLVRREFPHVSMTIGWKY